MVRTLGTLYYQSAPGEEKKTAQVVPNQSAKATTGVCYEGTTYTTPVDWLTKAFNNSGKSCGVQVDRKFLSTGTPRATRYVPPNRGCPFGGFF